MRQYGTVITITIFCLAGVGIAFSGAPLLGFVIVFLTICGTKIKDK